MHAIRNNISNTILILCLISCSPAANQESGNVTDEPGAGVSNLNLLQGEWWLDPSDPNALFIISGDSLYYPEQSDERFSVHIAGDTIFFGEDSSFVHFKLLTLSEDSLVYLDEALNESIHLYKGKQP